MIEPAVYRELGLKDEEYQTIERLLGREPTATELAMFSVEWSEHCGYPRSRPLLRLLPREGKYAPRVAGDAGGIEAAPGLTVLFKLESHNHPSQVEPKQGAATGIGGIIRDIFTMGARPIACLNSLHFGELDTSLARFLFAGVVDGIQFYGNCVGVPTVAGEVYFNRCFRGNCLVNVMCVGVVPTDRIALGRADGPGNAVMYVGSSTGRDGIGGCSVLASHEFGEDEEKRPTVQIGDPFTEKCLIEACLEALDTGAIIGMKDMGAAGLTCTTSEMAAAAGTGMDVDLALVPRREEGMEPYELMMSESQERMLLCVKAGEEERVAGIFHKWDLNAVVIGRVTDDGILRVRDNGKVVAAMGAQDLATPPAYDMPVEEPEYYRQAQAADLAGLPLPKDYDRTLLDLLAAPNIASKRWVWEQFDHMVQINTTVLPGDGDAAVLRLKDAPGGFVVAGAPAVAVTTDCNSRYCYLDPFVGAQIAVAEAARNVVCTGAEPAGITDGLNFGNPEKPDRFWQFRRAVEGLVRACGEFGIPVVSGNVSFYNETPTDVVHPTPVIGMVGVIEDLERRCTMDFKEQGDEVVLLGETLEELGGTEYLAVVHGMETGRPPALDLEREKAVQRACLAAIRTGLVQSAHDCSDGGLAVALAESCIRGNVGAEIRLPEEQADMRLDAALFGESQSRIVLSVRAEDVAAVGRIADAHGAPWSRIGRVAGSALRIETPGGAPIVDLPVAEMEERYEGAIPGYMG
ncbi:MAG: phosphoribosylformylglycinamidine synthase subunit PurL [Armatimonadota bacterium]|nr:MAG: phosphoribosylformylglycinamidine synthase subunit PurL [Armatimonadota bacterium]